MFQAGLARAVCKFFSQSGAGRFLGSGPDALRSTRSSLLAARVYTSPSPLYNASRSWSKRIETYTCLSGSFAQEHISAVGAFIHKTGGTADQGEELAHCAVGHVGRLVHFGYQAKRARDKSPALR